MAEAYLEGWDDIWVVVPARGGSRGVPGKNLKMLGSRPLIHHVLSTLNAVLPPSRIVVSTDDDEIARVCTSRATIHHRPPGLAQPDTTLDRVGEAVARWLVETHGAKPDQFFLTVQPTSPFLGRDALAECVTRLRGGSRSVLTVRDDRHLRWTVDPQGDPRPLYDERVNRQELPPSFVETGGVIGTRIADLLESGTRIGEPIALVELPPDQALDIDTHQDWAIAEFLVGRRKVFIRADGSRELGMGHVHRALALAYELSHHHLTIVTRGDGEFALGYAALAEEAYPLVVVDSDDDFIELLERERPEITVLDILDTSRAFGATVAGCSGFLVTIEDLGPGSRSADLVINDLYTDLYPQENHWYGVQHAILARTFDQLGPPAPPDDGSESGGRDGSGQPDPGAPDSEVETILVTFGGTDEGNLTERALRAVSETGYTGRVRVVLGPGYAHGDPDLDALGLEGGVHREVKDMVSVMQDADLAITSAGRTVTELMVVGVPTIVLCQNLRELRHTHASGPFGVINLGLGEYVPVESAAEHIGLILEDPRLREDMRRRATAAVRDRSNRQICRKMLDQAEAKLARMADGPDRSTDPKRSTNP